MNEEKTYEDFQHICSLRHKMHISSTFNEWATYLEEMRREMSVIKAVIELPSLEVDEGYDPDCEDLECSGDCELCREYCDDLLSDNKESTNDKIEKWMDKMEEKYDLHGEITPSGEARARWMNSH